jgi:hypothetical protein
VDDPMQAANGQGIARQNRLHDGGKVVHGNWGGVVDSIAPNAGPVIMKRFVRL